MAVQPIPDDYPGATPYLCMVDAAGAIAFYEKAFDGVERMRLCDPSGKIAHAELMIGDALVMLAEESPEYNAYGPIHFGGSPVRISLYVEDVDRVVEQAVASGATLAMPVADQFYGDRSGRIVDPFGHTWILATRIEDVSPEEMQRRFDEMTR